MVSAAALLEALPWLRRERGGCGTQFPACHAYIEGACAGHLVAMLSMKAGFLTTSRDTHAARHNDSALFGDPRYQSPHFATTRQNNNVAVSSSTTHTSHDHAQTRASPRPRPRRYDSCRRSIASATAAPADEPGAQSPGHIRAVGRDGPMPSAHAAAFAALRRRSVRCLDW